MTLPPREAWIEIALSWRWWTNTTGRFPRGKRGLKFSIYKLLVIVFVTLPPREAWIEITPGKRPASPPHGLTLPPREAWIEISARYLLAENLADASPAGSVD